MIRPWGTFFAKLVAQQLTYNPRLSEQEAIDRVKIQLLNWGLSEDKCEEFAQEYETLRPVFHHKGVLNPHYLEEQLGKKIFLHVIDAREGRYTLLKEFMESWTGEHSRFVLFGAEDVLVILYGTTEDEDAWTRYVKTERGWPVDDLPVVKTSFFKGYRVEAPHAEIISDISPSLINKIVDDYWDPALQDIRTRLEEANVLLGPTVFEDFQKTERVRAFVAVWVGGRYPQSQESFEQILLRIPEFKQCVRSIYHCMGRYHLVIEIVCNNIKELDRITEFMQKPEGATYSIETTTFVVASTEVEALPTVSLETQAPWEEQIGAYGSLVRRIVAEEIIPKGAIMMRRFAELPDEEKLFLVQALEEIRRTLPSGIEPKWKEHIDNSKDQFIAGILEHSVPKLKQSVTSLSPAVEAACKRALRLTVEVLYLRNYSYAQRELRLPSANFNNYTLGWAIDAFRNINKNVYYKEIGLTFPRDFLRKLEYFKELRNEFSHKDPAEETRNFIVLSREVRDVLICGLEVINWLSAHILTRNTLPLSVVPTLLEMARSEAEEGILAEVSISVQRSSEQVKELLLRLNRLEREQRISAQKILQELAALSAIGSASSRQERLWRHRLDIILEKENEILSYLEEPAKSRTQALMSELRKAGGSISLNLLADAIWYILMNISPVYLPTVLSWFI